MNNYIVWSYRVVIVVTKIVSRIIINEALIIVM